MSGYIGNIPVPQATQTRQTFTATASQTTFNTAGYSVGYVDVFLNGVKLAPADYTATNGSDIVLAVGAASGDILETVAYEIFQVLDQDFTGDFTVDGSTFVVDSTNNRIGINTSSPSMTIDVDGSSGPNDVARFSGPNSGGLTFRNATANEFIMHTATSDALIFGTAGNNERMRIDSSGNVGVGTSSPSQSWTGGTARTVQLQGPSSTITALRVNEASDTYGDLQLISGASNEVALYNFNNGAMRLGTNGSERMRIDSSGNVGIGTSSPVNNSNRATLGLQGAWGGQLDIMVGSTVHAQFGTDNFSTGLSARIQSQDGIVFKTNGSNERMRIDSSGNLLVGTTSTSIVGSGGLAAKPQGSGVRLDISNSGGATMLLDRRTNDGDIISFYHDGTNMGSIDTSFDNLLIRTAGDKSGIRFDTNNITPFKNGSEANGTVDLGYSGGRFKDLYLSGGIQFDSRSNKLDDYEEGTWTPSFDGLTNTPTYHNNYGKYTKIGRVVTVQFFMQTNLAPTFSSNTAELKITGLPFTVDGSGYTGSQGVALTQGLNWNSSYNTQSATGQIASGVNTSEQMQFFVSGSGGIRGIVNNSAAAAGFIIEATVTYFVTD